MAKEINCLDPDCIFNRALVPFIIKYGYMNKRIHVYLSDPDRLDFPFQRFNPYRFGICSYRTDKESKKPPKQRKFRVDLTAMDNYYTWDDNGEKQPLFCLVPCGHCDICQHTKIERISTQLLFESQCYDCPPIFFTLTYRDACLPVGGVSKEDVQKFLKRLRHNVKQEFRYFIVSEYGKINTRRPHYHGIIFGLKYDVNNPSSVGAIHDAFAKSWSLDRRSLARDDIEQLYFNGRMQDVYKSQLGIIDVQPTYGRSFRYVSKYILKKNNVPAGQLPNFILRSNRYGIGFRYDVEGIYKYLSAGLPTTPYRMYDKWSGQLRDVCIPKNIINKILPSKSRYINDEVKYVIRCVNGYLSELCNFRYPAYGNIENLFKEFEQTYGFLGYYILPHVSKKQLDMQIYKTRVFPEWLSFGQDETSQPVPLCIEYMPRVTQTKLALKNCYNILKKHEEYYKRYKPDVLYNLKLRNTYFQKLNELSSGSAGMSASLINFRKEKVRFLENTKI